MHDKRTIRGGQVKQKIIKNEYDGPQKPKKALVPAAAPSFSLDYANSDNAWEIDTGIRDTIKGIRLSILAMGIGLAKIKAKGLYADLKYHSMAKYIERLGEDTGMERSTIFNWLYIGEAFIKYRQELEKIGFNDEDGPTKLLYVDRAFNLHKKREVFDKLKALSLCGFIAYSKGDGGIQEGGLSKIRVVGDRIYVGEKLAITLADELDQKTKDYFTNLNVEAGEALEAGEVLYTARLYDMEELRRFSRAAERLKKELRVNYKGKIKGD